MNILETNKQGDDVEIKIININRPFARVILMLIGLMMFGIPLIGFVLNLVENDKENKVVFIGIIAYSLFMLLISRFFFWGLWGQELIVKKKDSLMVQYDYKLWKSKFRKFEFSSISIELDELEKIKDEEIVKLVFHFGEEELRTVLKIPIEKAIELSHILGIEYKINRDYEN